MPSRSTRMLTRSFLSPRTLAVFTLTLVVALALLLSACVEAPPPRHRVARAAPLPPPVEPAPAQPTQVYVYPTGGQAQEQLGRDRYECHLWAVKQSNFDPSVTAVL